MKSNDAKFKFSGSKAKARIKECGRTTEWVARQLGTSVGHLYEVLNERRAASRPLIKLLAIVLETTEDEFNLLNQKRVRAS
jgi:hypothetical protein